MKQENKHQAAAIRPPGLEPGIEGDAYIPPGINQIRDISCFKCFASTWPSWRNKIHEAAQLMSSKHDD